MTEALCFEHELPSFPPQNKEDVFMRRDVFPTPDTSTFVTFVTVHYRKPFLRRELEHVLTPRFGDLGSRESGMTLSGQFRDEQMRRHLDYAWKEYLDRFGLKTR